MTDNYFKFLSKCNIKELTESLGSVLSSLYIEELKTSNNKDKKDMIEDLMTINMFLKTKIENENQV